MLLKTEERRKNGHRVGYRAELQCSGCGRFAEHDGFGTRQTQANESVVSLARAAGWTIGTFWGICYCPDC